MGAEVAPGFTEAVMTMSAPSLAHPHDGAKLEAHLRATHAAWLEEVHHTLNPAVQADAGAWVRWCAVRHIETKFYPRFERERGILQTLHEHLGSIMVARLWAAAELLVLLRWQLDQLASLCHQPVEFSTITRKLRSAVEHWCQEVEAALNQLSWADLPADVRRALLELDGTMEVSHVAAS
jgi:hypothetical protein